VKPQGDIGVCHPEYGEANFYGDTIRGWWPAEDAFALTAARLWPEEDHPVRLTRITTAGATYAPLHGTYELFEAHLGLWKPGGWTGEVTFRKVETDDIALARGYARDVADRMFSGRNAALIDYGHFHHVPNTLFFWCEPSPDHVRSAVVHKAAGWRSYAYNRYLDDQAALQAKLKQAQAAEKKRLAAARTRFKVLSEADKQKRVAEQVRDSIRQHGGDDMVGVPDHMRRPTVFRTVAKRDRGIEDVPLDTADMNRTLARFEAKHRHVVTGSDKKGRPVYSTGQRRKDGVWVCPPAGKGIVDALRPDARPMLSVTNVLDDGCRRRSTNIRPERDG